MTAVAPHGAWRSPIDAQHVARGQLRLHDMHVDGGELYWSEDRPLEGGRCTVCRLGEDGQPRDVTPAGFDARSMVHEYGGGAWTVHCGTLFLVERASQRLHRLQAGTLPIPITEEPPTPAGIRYADLVVAPDGAWLVCVRESHGAGEVRNELVAVPTNGSGGVRTLASGRDFYAFPRLSPAGDRLAWIEWDHPRMPWDGTELWAAGFRDGALWTGSVLVAGGPEESVFQPEWSPDGRLHFISDRSGWWNLYRRDGTGTTALAPGEVEFGVPAWVLGLRTYAFLPGDRIACLYGRGPEKHLGIVEPGAGRAVPLDLPFTAFSPRLGVVGDRLAVIAATPTAAPALVLVDPMCSETRMLRASDVIDLDPAWLSIPRPLEFPAAGQTAHALYYAPVNPRFRAPQGERPPLLLIAHGGPTAQVVNSLNLMVQFFTSRGFAVCEVDYGGSSGYGRAYRRRLEGGWGIVDVADSIAAARHLADLGLVDPARMAIRGASAGGYTALCALTFHNTFAAGASWYGLVDLEISARDTHKFESHYIDSLVGPYPDAAAIYRERSPLRQSDRLSRPVLILQGHRDTIVPPAQAERLASALDANRIPFAYVAFEDEGHGFRSAANIVRAIEAELFFYSRVFRFEPADPLHPIPLHHLNKLGSSGVRGYT